MISTGIRNGDDDKTAALITDGEVSSTFLRPLFDLNLDASARLKNLFVAKASRAGENILYSEISTEF